MDDGMILVIGGGVAGLAAAWRCAQAGAAVTVLEADRVGGAASRVAAGYIEPGVPETRMGEDAQALIDDEWTSARQWPAFVEELVAETGLDVDFRTDGQLRIAYAEDVPAARADHDRRVAAGWQAEWLDAAGVRALEPALSPEIEGGCFLPRICWVDGRLLCAALAEALRRRGAILREGARARGLIVEGGACRGAVLEDGEALRADRVILAGGWARGALQALPQEVPAAAPVRGVILALGMAPEAPLIRRIVRTPAGPLVPRSDGRLLVGVTRSPGDTRGFADAGAVAALLENGFRALPGARALPFLEAAWGIRPYLETDAPFAQASAEAAGLIYSLGYGADGYLRAPLWSRRAADLALGRNAPSA